MRFTKRQSTQNLSAQGSETLQKFSRVLQSVNSRGQSTKIRTTQGTAWVLFHAYRSNPVITIFTKCDYSRVADGTWFFPSGKSVVVSHLLQRKDRVKHRRVDVTSLYQQRMACYSTWWVSDHFCASQIIPEASSGHLTPENLSQARVHSLKAYFSRQNLESEMQSKIKHMNAATYNLLVESQRDLTGRALSKRVYEKQLAHEPTRLLQSTAPTTVPKAREIEFIQSRK